MSKLIDITGNRYGRLVVLEKAKTEKNGVAIWKCLCDCGNITYVRGSNLKWGAVKSCGCLRKLSRTATHKMSKTRLYHTWASIKSRCYYAGHKSYNNYGGRGITMCDEWANSSEAFIKWALSSGYADDMTIERIDVNGNYTPENCKWIPAKDQAKNRRSCRVYTYNGKTQNLTNWCNELQLPYKNIHNRLVKLGWSFERAISEPIHIDKRNKSNKKG